MTLFHAANPDSGIGDHTIMHAMYRVAAFSQIGEELQVFLVLDIVRCDRQTPMLLLC